VAAMTAWPLGRGLPRRLAWEARRLRQALNQRLGLAGWLTLALLLGAAGLAWQQAQWRQQLATLQSAQLAAPAQTPSAAPSPSGPSARPALDRGRDRLQDFAAILVPPQDVAFVVQAIIEQATGEGLLLARGDYRAQPDAPGGFVRYRMSMPVKGPAAAVHRLIVTALRAQPALALENVQFRRDTVEARDVEARIQWTLYVRPRATP
jgi:hypothetical protein